MGKVFRVFDNENLHALFNNLYKGMSGHLKFRVNKIYLLYHMNLFILYIVSKIANAREEFIYEIREQRPTTTIQ